MDGKRTCSLLKSIRCKIAEQNGIVFSTPECTYQGECRGTCPKCEAELRYLTKELEKLRQSGKRVAVAGIAATVIATSAAGCARQQNEWDYTDEMGLVAAEPPAEDQPAEEVELDGDVAYPEDNGVTLTGAIAAPTTPEITAFATMDMMQISDALYGMAFLRLDSEWQAYRVFHEESERYAEYSDENVTVRVYYNEAGFITEASVDTTPGENCDV